jgi:hypothetical protein
MGSTENSKRGVLGDGVGGGSGEEKKRGEEDIINSRRIESGATHLVSLSEGFSQGNHDNYKVELYNCQYHQISKNLK